jgi:hypothetical protein
MITLEFFGCTEMTASSATIVSVAATMKRMRVKLAQDKTINLFY